MLVAGAVAVPLLVSSGTTYAAAGDVWVVTQEANAAAGKPTVPDGGGRAFFSSAATDVVGGDVNDFTDAFWRRRDGVTTKLSTAPGGLPANGASSDVQVSADGGTVAFTSTASNLWNSDHNEKRDVYACTRTCFSVGWVARGMEPNGSSMRPRLSADGRWVAFASDADNWVRNDTNGVRDVFVANVRNGAVTRVSVASDGSQLTRGSDHPSISADGTLVTFRTAAPVVRRDTNERADIYLRDLTAGTTTLVSQSVDEKIADGASGTAAVAKRCLDGTCFPTVVFTSAADNLVGKDTNRARDVFVRERGSTARISVSSTGREGRLREASWAPSISRDGRWVAFASDADLTGRAGDASDQSQVLLRDRSDGTVRILSATGGLPGDGDSAAPSLSPNGKYAAFLSKATNLDTLGADNRTWDVFVTTVY
jgi:Tol biopolymer transport system component